MRFGVPANAAADASVQLLLSSAPLLAPITVSIAHATVDSNAMMIAHDKTTIEPIDGMYCVCTQMFIVS